MPAHGAALPIKLCQASLSSCHGHGAPRAPGVRAAPLLTPGIHHEGLTSGTGVVLGEFVVLGAHGTSKRGDPIPMVWAHVLPTPASS